MNDKEYLDIFKQAVPIWTEDDARPVDRERLSDALKRFFPFGNFERGRCVYRLDLGDCVADFYRRGSIYIIAGYHPEGGFIDVAKIPNHQKDN